MSGIFGIFNKDGAPVDANTLHTMRQSMLHWARDGNGIWRDGAIGLGHLLMHNTPESRYEQQPQVHPVIPNLVISADSRIDNRDDLMSSLGVPGPDRKTLADNELILQAYERWGASFVNRLVGAFAFAIWDGRTQSLLCGRDHVGFRPFYYHNDDRRFVFATDIKAILAVDGVPRRLDDLFVFAHYTNSKFYMRGRTAFLDIGKLLPAHTLTVRHNRYEQQAYWCPGQETEIRLASNDEYAEMLREQLQQAVRCRLRSSQPISSHLSGGLDSSTVTVLAARQLRTMGQELAGVHSWSPPPESVAFDPGNEYGRIEAVCRQERLQCNYVTISPEDIESQLSRDISVDPAETLMMELHVQRRLAERGVGVALSGWGGDEIVSTKGRGYLAELLVRGRWRQLLRESRQFSTRHETSWRSLLRQQFLTPLMPDRLYSLLRQDVHPLLRQLIASKRVTWGDFEPEELRLLREQNRRFRERPGVRRNQLRELNLGHLEYRLEAWANAGAQSGVEYRYPLLDQRLISFALRVPARLYFQQGWQRFLLRYAMDGLLPKEVCWHKSKQDPALMNAHVRAREVGLKRFMEGQTHESRAHNSSQQSQKTRFAQLGRQVVAVRYGLSVSQ